MHRIRIAQTNCGGCAKGVTATLRQVDAARLDQALRAAAWQAERIPA